MPIQDARKPSTQWLRELTANPVENLRSEEAGNPPIDGEKGRICLGQTFGSPSSVEVQPVTVKNMEVDGRDDEQ